LARGLAIILYPEILGVEDEGTPCVEVDWVLVY